MHERKVLIITCKSYANVRMLDMTEEMYLCTYGSVLLVGMIIYLSSSRGTTVGFCRTAMIIF